MPVDLAAREEEDNSPQQAGETRTDSAFDTVLNAAGPRWKIVMTCKGSIGTKGKGIKVGIAGVPCALHDPTLPLFSPVPLISGQFLHTSNARRHDLVI